MMMPGLAVPKAQSECLQGRSCLLDSSSHPCDLHLYELSALAARMRIQSGDRTTGHAGTHVVSAARENDRNPRAQNDAGRIGIGEERQLLGEKVAGFHVRDDRSEERR